VAGDTFFQAVLAPSAAGADPTVLAVRWPDDGGKELIVETAAGLDRWRLNLESDDATLTVIARDAGASGG
jgi:hypothetical protein